ncbi:MarR family winged helix-turn-helix transcriptional regulator [Pseudobutyrivibrio sp.]|uniref:MarR family winged helix-turn-helix transcriptional regulator n=1 Tax=Pseudobutyrivibrio sp. TaxID=2014367 RepID=UPI001DF60156|nr:MarR family transcriptional regulator [Pseudobutyrivibrio sp.]MBE5911326.1 MarR family transcriptional regulator [Pseudobutyrivibrio sp.]
MMFLGSKKLLKKEQVLEMLEQTLSEVYTKFKIHFYQEMFKKLNSRETSLTTVELFCVEIIYALKNPTVAEFANFINVSSPNAAYKVNSLIKKGYIEKIQSETDRREFHLRVTDKYLNYFNLSQKYVNTVVERSKEFFSKEQVEILDGILKDMSHELMQEVNIPPVTI